MVAVSENVCSFGWYVCVTSHLGIKPIVGVMSGVFSASIVVNLNEFHFVFNLSLTLLHTYIQYIMQVLMCVLFKLLLLILEACFILNCAVCTYLNSSG